ncbi:hypothetical protein LR48_Vigan304s003900 [Vigna angularis]|uniref:Uncharacterized protein n=1 Tax=Phaseolus angularis TaxID=3914 RepID=A0A0L9T7X5_PHAAN|nr:hypothetical protein LR48_Vigan304s003900 [Vigna angularis]
MAIYKEPREFTLFRVGGLRRDELLCAFVIAWIMLPRGGNHAQLTIEDVFLFHALRAKVPINWISVIRDQMTKITRQKKSMIEKLVLHHMGLRKDEKCWSFKEEHIHVMEEVEPLRVDKSSYCFKPQSEFEKFMMEMFKKQDIKLSRVQKSLSGLHRQLNCALKINAFGGTSEDDSKNEKEVQIDEDCIKISDSE